MKNRTLVATAAVLLVIVVASIFAVNVIDARIRQVSVARAASDQVNVPLRCDQGLYLADHQCVPTCPHGFIPGLWSFQSSSDVIPCMSAGGRPVSVNDLAGLRVSADNGVSAYDVISDVPMAKVPVAVPGYNYRYWSLQVSQQVLDSLPTLGSMPSVRTEIATIGDSVATFKILRIDVSSVTGNHSEFFPIGQCCTTISIHVGDEVGVLCEGLSEKVALIDYLNQKVMFTVRTLPIPYGGCPICLSGDTVVDTTQGLVNVKDLTVGMTVWTVNQYGQRVSAPIIRVSMIHVPVTHVMVHLVLNDGRQLYGSPGHPTTDGRKLGQLRASDTLDGSHVRVAELVPYNQSYTYDLLPGGDTGFYWANGILVASTLK